MSAPVGPLLGALPVAAFLARHWQKEAHLVRAAIPGFTGSHNRAALVGLAMRDDVESRLVLRERGRWSMRHGPFRRADFRALPASGWTLLVQGLNLHSRDADALLRRFAFLPFARLDDVMASYAVAGGGVGPHFDSYDVFLLQGFGRRRWRYGRQSNLALVPDLPLKILRTFAPQHDEVLEPGDLLYLPPHYAHEGVAIEPCTTYSIGFRAGTAQELATAFLDFLRDQLALDGRYADPDLRPTREPARIDPRMQRRVTAMLEGIRWDAQAVARFLGSHLSEPGAAVVFERPVRALGRAEFARSIAKRGVALDRRTRLLYDDRRLYLNGVDVEAPAASRAELHALANARALPAKACTALSDATISMVHDWYRDGFVTVGS